MVSLLKNNKNVLKTIGLYRIFKKKPTHEILRIPPKKTSLNVGGYLQPKSTQMESSLPAGFRGKKIFKYGGFN